jgi:hypothetical protein
VCLCVCGGLCVMCVCIYVYMYGMYVYMHFPQYNPNKYSVVFGQLCIPLKLFESH